MPRIGSNIYKRKDGRWEGRYIKGYNETGKIAYGYVYAKTYQEVKKKLTESYVVKPSSMSTYSNITFAEVAKMWLSNVSLKIKYSTYAGYVFALDRHILPIIGGCKIKRLSSMDMDNFTKEKLANGKLNHDGGLAVKTVRDMLTIIKSVVSYACQENIIDKSGFTITYPKKHQSDMEVISHQEQKILETFLYNDLEPHKLGVLLCLYTGLRIGEICALRWEDISISTATVSVRRTLQRVKNLEEKEKRKQKS